MEAGGKPAKRGKREAEADRLFAFALERHRAGRVAEAEAFYRRAREAAPAAPEIPYNLALALHQQGRRDEAAASWRAALALRPDHAGARNNLGILLAEAGELAEAEEHLRAVLAVGVSHPALHNNLAVVLRDGGRPEEALVEAWRAVALDPDYADAHSNLAILLDEAGQTAAAVAEWRRALTLDPNHAQAHFNLGLALLRQGEMAQGWREFAWRWRGGARHLLPRGFAGPEWGGEDLGGGTLLLYAEQGYGDAIHFARYATVAAARGARVVLEVRRPLARLLATVSGVSAVAVAGEDDLPPYRAHLPLMSVPGVVGTTLATIPADVPYVRAEAGAAAAWRARLAEALGPGLRVGLVWAGDPRPGDARAHAIDKRRSVALARLLPLLATPGAVFVSLQKGEAAAQIRDLPAALRPYDAMDEMADFADTAALVANLDLVIAVDTAVAHLAGALGRPVWILSRFDGCWRWLLGRDDSPWYPTARLFRQERPGDWDGVVARLAAELARAIC